MYKVLPVDGGWSVFWIESPDIEPRLIAKAVQRPKDEDGKYDPYKQRQAAYRRCRSLNKALENVNAMIAETGAFRCS